MKRIIFAVMLVVLFVLPAFASSGQDMAPGGVGFGWMFAGGMLALGLIASPGTLVSLQKNFNAIFNKALEAMPPIWPKYAMEIPSGGASEDYQWLGDTPAMREWLGDKFVKDILGYGFSVPNKPWESTIGVKRTDIEDDRLGKYSILVTQLGQEGQIKQDQLLSDLRVAGTSTLCYDGKYFYAANHVAGKSGTQSNLITGAGVAIANITTDFLKVRTAFRRFKTDQGKPFVRQPGKLSIVCIIPPDLEGVFENLANATLISGGDNTLKGAFEYIVDNNLADTIDWYADFVGAPIRPFVLQMRERPHLVALDQPDNDVVFNRAEYRYSNEARFNATYGLWPYSIKINNS
jgi:phage major head subunit gpT-like protein